jgi:DNA-directed RNA polymerase subunit M/transcription elongation factor TFIIS
LYAIIGHRRIKTMALQIVPAKKEEITRIVCPECKEKVKSVGLKKDSKVDGLTFVCKKCSHVWEVKTV